MPRTGLEPAQPQWSPAPQAGVSTNFTIWAIKLNYKSNIN